MPIQRGLTPAIVAAALALGSGCMGPGMMGGYAPDQGPSGGYGPGCGMGPGIMSGGMMGPGMMGGGMDPGIGRALWLPDLKDDQRKEILKVEDEVRKKNWDIAGKMQDEMAKLRDAYWASGKRDRSVIATAYKQIGELRQQRIENSLDAADKIEKVLTAEQHEQLRRWGPWWSNEVQ